MDADEEYSAYVSARWSTLMRSAILLGCQVHEAEDLVQATLVKCYVAWDKVRKAHDKDAYVYRVLVNTHTSNRRRYGEDGPAVLCRPHRATNCGRLGCPGRDGQEPFLPCFGPPGRRPQPV